MGSGDFTHPAWRRELEETLFLMKLPDFTASGALLNSRPELRGISPAIPRLFCLQTEISSIYKRGGKTRKIHNLVFMPDLEAVERLCETPCACRKPHSDGRPILGLDSRDLLEIVLRSQREGCNDSAHIWTPWFSLLAHDQVLTVWKNVTGT